MAIERDKLVIEIDLSSADAKVQIEQLNKAIGQLKEETKGLGEEVEDSADSFDDQSDAAEGAGQSQDKYSSSLDKSFKAITLLNQGLELALKAYNSIKAVVDTTTDAFAVQEKAEIDLANALKINGEFTNAVMDDFKAFASQLQETTTVGDETTLGLLKVAKALGRTDEEAKNMITAAANLSAATGKELNTSFEQINKTFGGTAGELAELVPELRGLTKEQLMAGDATAILIKKFDGFAKASRDTFSGQQLAAMNAFGDVLEEIGELFVKVFDLGGGARDMEQFFIRIGTAIDDFRQKLQFVLDNVDFNKLLTPLKEVAMFIGAILTPALIKLSIPLALVAVKVVAITAAVAGLVVAFDLLIRNGDQIGVVFDAIGAAIAAAALKGVEKFGQLVKFMIDKIGDLLMLAVKSGTLSGKIAAGIQDGLNEVSLSISKAQVDFAKGSEEAAASAAASFSKLKDKGLLGGLIDTVKDVKGALAGFGDFQAQNDAARKAADEEQIKRNAEMLAQKEKERKANEALLAQQEAAKMFAEEQNKLDAVRLQNIENIEAQNAILAANLAAMDQDARERAETFLKLQLNVIDQRIQKLKEEGVILASTKGFSQERIDASNKILEGLEDQKRLITDITLLKVQTPGEAFAGFLKDAIDGFKDLKKLGADAFDGIMNFDPSSIDFSAMGDGLMDAGKGFIDALSDPAAMADFAGNMVDVGIDVGSSIGSAIGAAVDTVSAGVGMFMDGLDLLMSFDQVALDLLKNFPEMLKNALSALPEFFRELPKIMIEVVDMLVDMLPGILQEFLEAVPAIIDAFIEGAAKIIDMLPGLVAQIAEKLPEFVTQILDALPMLIEKIFEAIPQIITSLMRAIPQIFSNLMDRLPAIIGALIEGMIGATGEIVGSFIDTFITKGGALRMAESLVKAIIKLVPTIIKALAKGLMRAFQGIFRGFKMPDIDIKPFEKAVNKVVNKVSKGAGKIADEIFGVIDIPTKGLKDIKKPEDVVDFIGEAITKAGERVKGLWDAFLDLLKKAWMWVWDNILEPIVSAIREVWLFVWRLIEPLISALREVWLWVWENVLQPIVGWIRQAWQFVVDFFMGFAELVRMAWQVVIDLFNTLAETVKMAWQFLVDLFNGMGELVATAWQFVVDLFNGLGETVSKAWTWVKTEILDKLAGIVSGAWDWVKTNIIDKISLSNINAAFKDVVDFFGKLLDVEEIKKAFKPILDAFKNITKPMEDLAKAFTNNGAITGLTDALKGLTDPIERLINALKRGLGGGGGLGGLGGNGLKIPGIGGITDQGVNIGGNSGITVSSGGTSIGGKKIFALGGLVGPEGGFVETPGEFVIRKSSVDSIGPDTLDFVNRTGQFPSKGSGMTSVLNVEPGSITIIAQEGEDAGQIADRVLDELKERSNNGRFVISADGIRA